MHVLSEAEGDSDTYTLTVVTPRGVARRRRAAAPVAEWREHMAALVAAGPCALLAAFTPTGTARPRLHNPTTAARPRRRG